MPSAWKMPAKSVPALVALAVAMSGCRVEANKNGNDDVKVATPFGHMQVNTDNAKVQSEIGISVYPGAVPEVKEKGHTDQADVNFSFGSFKLRVKAMSFLTSDALSKVEEFYRKDLARYGTVITCSGQQPVGEPTRTPDGLTCEEDRHGGGVHSDVSGTRELKTGSKQHQHVVALEQQGAQTKIGLVALDLPGGHFGAGSDDADEDKRQ